MQPLQREYIGNVGLLIRHLEWHVLPEYLPVLSQAILQCSNDRLLPTNPQIQRTMILHKLKELVGNDVFDVVLSAINSNNLSISCGLSPSLSLSTKGCSICHGQRIFHSFCVHCGEIFALGYEPTEPVYFSLTQPSLNATDYYLAKSMASMDANNETVHPAKKYEEMAIRGIKSLGRLANFSPGFCELGGDIMFLLRNVVFACSGTLQQSAMSVLRQLTIRWIEMEEEIFDEEKCTCSSEVHLEALHTMVHLLRVYDATYPNKASAQLEAIQAYKENHSKRRRRLTEHEEMELAVAVSIAENNLHSRVGSKTTAAVVSETASDENHSDCGLNDSSAAAAGNNNTAEQIMLVTDEEAMKIRTFIDKCKTHILHLMEYETLYDWFGYDPTRHIVPMTAVNYCNGCGEQWKGNDHVPTRKISRKNCKSNKQSKASKLNKIESKLVDNNSNSDCVDLKICPHCGSKVEQCIDYYALTAAVCWIYIWHDCQIDICDDSDLTGCVRNSTLGDVILILQQVRSYQSLQQLRRTGFINQCYFITHLIYAFSDWGQHALPRHLFAEEFQFLVENFSTVIELQNCELVGEFLQCLRILQYSPSREADSELRELETVAKEYLLKVGKEPGVGVSGNGPWLSPTQSFYTQYHTSYCAAMGLLDYRFQDEQDKPLRLSSMIKYLEEVTMKR